MIFGFIVLLSSLGCVADLTKCLFLNDEPYMVRPTIIDMNPVELKYYPFMISLNKRIVSCNVLSPKICLPKETKDINAKVCNMITKKDETKAITEHISCEYLNTKTYNSKQKWNNKTC